MAETHAEGHRERLRERYLKNGAQSLQDYELLELLLTYVIPRKDTKAIAKALIRHFGSFAEVMEAEPQALLAVDGIGERSAVLLGLVSDMHRVHARQAAERQRNRNLFNSPEAASEYCKALLQGKSREEFYLIALNSKMQRLKVEKTSSGDVDHVDVSFRSVAAMLLTTKATAVILTHNHPAETPNPSRADIDLTQRLTTFLARMGIRVCDHIIVAGDSTFSFCQAGLMGSLQEKET